MAERTVEIDAVALVQGDRVPPVDVNGDGAFHHHEELPAGH